MKIMLMVKGERKEVDVVPMSVSDKTIIRNLIWDEVEEEEFAKRGLPIPNVTNPKAWEKFEELLKRPDQGWNTYEYYELKFLGHMDEFRLKEHSPESYDNWFWQDS